MTGRQPQRDRATEGEEIGERNIQERRGTERMGQGGREREIEREREK